MSPNSLPPALCLALLFLWRQDFYFLVGAGSSWEPKPRELPSAVPGASVEGLSSLNLRLQILLIRDGTYASMSTSPEGLGRNLFSFSLLPYLVLSVGGQMTNKIVPSY